MVTRTTPQKRPLDKRLPEKRWPSEPPPPPVLTASACNEPLSKVDLAWLRMDTPANLMMILGVWTIKPSLSYATVCQRLAQRLPGSAGRMGGQVFSHHMVLNVEIGVGHPAGTDALPLHALRKAWVLTQALLKALAHGGVAQGWLDGPDAQDHHQVGRRVHAQPGEVNLAQRFATGAGRQNRRRRRL